MKSIFLFFVLLLGFQYHTLGIEMHNVSKLSKVEQFVLKKASKKMERQQKRITNGENTMYPFFAGFFILLLGVIVMRSGVIWLGLLLFLVGSFTLCIALNIDPQYFFQILEFVLNFMI